MCVLLEFLQNKTWAIPIMNPLSWFMINKPMHAVSFTGCSIRVLGSHKQFASGTLHICVF